MLRRQGQFNLSIFNRRSVDSKNKSYKTIYFACGQISLHKRCEKRVTHYTKIKSSFRKLCKLNSPNACNCAAIGCFNTLLHLVKMEIFVLETESCTWTRTEIVCWQYRIFIQLFRALGCRYSGLV